MKTASDARVTFEDRPAGTTVSRLAAENRRNLIKRTNRLACLDRSVARERFAEAVRALVGLCPELRTRPGSLEDAHPFLEDVRRELIWERGPAYSSTFMYATLWQFPCHEYTRMRFLPVYIDHHRYVFYRRMTPVAESLLIKLLCLSIQDSFVSAANVFTFGFTRRAKGSSVWCAADHPRFTSLADWADGLDHIAYSYDVLGCRFADPLFFYLPELSTPVWFTALHSRTVASFALPCKPDCYPELDQKRPSFGRTGGLLGMILPKDAEGRTVFVLPSGELSLPRETRVRETITATRSLYMLLTGDEPIWLTPAGRTAWDRLEWE